MSQISCTSKITVYVPLPDYHKDCPKVLVVCCSSHSHPIPLPSTTPALLKRELQNLLQDFDQDLPDLTPRRLLRHPLFRSYLKKALPHISFPIGMDLHPSLANLDHLASIINHAVKNQYPEGTGWSGVHALHEIQMQTTHPSDIYIRIVEEMTWAQLELFGEYQDPTDPLPLNSSDQTFWIIICMNPQRSHDLLQATAVQSDIAFKRVTGYKEFELVSFDRQSLSSVVYCRALLNSQSAVAHKYLFHKLRQLVHADTGQYIQYRHLHSPDLIHHQGIHHWGIDQDRGQAKGLSLHLQDIVRHELSPSTPDLHDSTKTLAQLTAYDHLHRLVRLCYVHVERNIKKAKVPESVKQDMQSLMCIQHPDWDGTLARIAQEGGTAGRDWIDDKIRSKFAFQAICQAQSHIPLDVWRAGDTSTNLSEGLHADVNREGIQCSLIGALRRGQHYDLMRLKSQQACRPLYSIAIILIPSQVHMDVGILARNRPTTHFLTQKRSIKRLSRHRTESLNKADATIIKHNQLLRKRHDQLQNAQEQAKASPQDQRLRQRLSKSRTEYQKQHDKSVALAGHHSGSGKETLWFPV
ncbi:uncharacterized protein ARMOST_09586 [Armillaria ostoyae]|uniref:Uncharacterized protein n=1 Tax=Armillaria ostoyae TaxID=47428 RepID=A0A284RBY7_ARMOS|nr:uncharacterized protein ARMOST_09586 [Armillaria ostoyae]